MKKRKTRAPHWRRAIGRKLDGSGWHWEWTPTYRGLKGQGDVLRNAPVARPEEPHVRT
jgi:hypothetical protein